MSLRTVFTFDAIASGAMALVLLVGFRPLGDVLDLPEPLLLGAGLILVPWVAFLAWMARQKSIDQAITRVVIAVNAAWVVASIAVTLGAGVDPSGWGVAFVAAQAVAVAALAVLQASRLAEASPAPSRQRGFVV
jgi:hypothetical protein